MVIISTSAMEVSIQAVSPPELACTSSMNGAEQAGRRVLVGGGDGRSGGGAGAASPAEPAGGGRRLPPAAAAAGVGVGVVGEGRRGGGEADQRGDRQRRREASEKPRSVSSFEISDWNGNGAALRARPCPFRRCECGPPSRGWRRRSCRRRSGRCGPRRRSRRPLCRRARR